MAGQAGPALGRCVRSKDRAASEARPKVVQPAAGGLGHSVEACSGFEGCRDRVRVRYHGADVLEPEPGQEQRPSTES